MKLRILGCSGGIGRELRTTSLLVDDDVLIDCGTGVGDLSIDEMARIDHVFLTHAHLDHIACLPLMMDTAGDLRSRPLIVHAAEGVIEDLRRHIFNGRIWPDFTAVPSREQPFLRFEALRLGEAVVLQGRSVEALPASHIVPANAYRLDSGTASVVFSGDTGPCPEFWAAVNQVGNLRALIIETAFPDREREIAVLSKHLCPAMLKDELAHLKIEADIYITHLKPHQAQVIMREIESCIECRKPRMLKHNQVLEF